VAVSLTRVAKKKGRRKEIGYYWDAMCVIAEKAPQQNTLSYAAVWLEY
jgi:hypothetical protein